MHWSTNYSNLKLHRNSRGRYIISFYIDGRRFRFSHGKCLGCTIKPNSLSGEAKDRASIELLSRFKATLDKGWTPESIEQNKTCYESLMEFTPSPSLSLGYQKELAKTANQFIGFLKAQELTSLPHSELNKRIVHDYLTTTSTTPSSFNHERARLSSIVGQIWDQKWWRTVGVRKTNDGLRVVDGYMIPFIYAHSTFVENRGGKWQFVLPDSYDPEVFVQRIKKLTTSSKDDLGNPQTFGKSDTSYEILQLVAESMK